MDNFWQISSRYAHVAMDAACGLLTGYVILKFGVMGESSVC